MESQGGTRGDDDAYAWEKRYERTWEDIQVGDDGVLRIEQPEGADWRLQQSAIPPDARRGVLRHVVVIWDVSVSAGDLDGDLKPSRAVAVANALITWVSNFFEQNPISRLAIVLAGRVLDSSGGEDREVMAGAQLWSPMASSPESHVKLLRAFAEQPRCAGQFSLQNALDLASTILLPLPAYATREVLLLVSSLSSCDPGDVRATIGEVRERCIRCSVLALQAETYICRLLATQTGGTFAVICDATHLSEELQAHLQPPALLRGPTSVQHSLIHMGLPAKVTTAQQLPCACHGTFSSVGYACTQCGAKACEIPCSCAVCGLVLVSSHHLARSTRHLMVLPAFERADKPPEEEAPAACIACAEPLNSSRPLWACPRCSSVGFCDSCNEYTHTTLRNCPHCELDGR